MDPNEIRVWAVLLLGMAWLGYLIWQKRKNVQLAKGNCLLLIRNKAGRWRFVLKPIDDDGLIELEPRNGKKAGKTFAVDSESAPDIDFPINKMSFVQTTIPMAVFNEENWDPLSNISGRPVLPPGLIDIIRNESWSQHGIRYSHEIQEREDQKSNPKRKSKVSWWVWIIALVLLAGAIFLYQKFANPKDGGLLGQVDMPMPVVCEYIEPSEFEGV